MTGGSRSRRNQRQKKSCAVSGGDCNEHDEALHCRDRSEAQSRQMSLIGDEASSQTEILGQSSSSPTSSHHGQSTSLIEGVNPVSSRSLDVSMSMMSIGSNVSLPGGIAVSSNPVATIGCSTNVMNTTPIVSRSSHLGLSTAVRMSVLPPVSTSSSHALPLVSQAVSSPAMENMMSVRNSVMISQAGQNMVPVSVMGLATTVNAEVPSGYVAIPRSSLASFQPQGVPTCSCSQLPTSLCSQSYIPVNTYLIPNQMISNGGYPHVSLAASVASSCNMPPNPVCATMPSNTQDDVSRGQFGSQTQSQAHVGQREHTQHSDYLNRPKDEIRRKVQSRRDRQRTRQRSRSPSSESDMSEVDDLDRWCDESDDDDENYESTRGRRTYVEQPKLPPFKNAKKESWEAWFNRFSDVAISNKWNDQRKLKRLLPKLQGEAGEFVYGELERSVRANYKMLVRELHYRFRRVETPKSFELKLRNRFQKPGESVSEYASDLKRLYCKAFPNRDSNTRREDLLRKFLEGLNDDDVKFHVEYIKEPEDIDAAVCEVVRYLDTIKTAKSKKVRMVRGDDEESDDEVKPIKQVKGNKFRSPPSKHGKGKPDADRQLERRDVTGTAISEKNSKHSDDGELSMAEIAGMFKNLMERFDHLSTVQANLANSGSNSNPDLESQRNYQNDAKSNNQNHRKRDFQCYRCGVLGHTSRYCLAPAPVEGVSVNFPTSALDVNSPEFIPPGR